MDRLVPIIDDIAKKHSLTDKVEQLRLDSFGRDPRATPTRPQPTKYKPKSVMTPDIRRETHDRIHRYIQQVSPHQPPIPTYTIQERQPFPLTSLTALAHWGQDPDPDFPLKLRDENGGHLGITRELDKQDPTFPEDTYKKEHADVQPLRDDLDNYSSAEDNMETVRNDYLEEREMGMTHGPIYTTEELK